MKIIPKYAYVGPEEIYKRVEEKYEGTRIRRASDISKWLVESKQERLNGLITLTFVISEQEELLIADRHLEHVVCAGGRDVLSAGEITFSFEEREVCVYAITNQSTGYCPRASSWEVVDKVLNKIEIDHPYNFTNAYEFRYCENCHNRNLIKDELYECILCGAELDLEWNFQKKK